MAVYLSASPGSTIYLNGEPELACATRSGPLVARQFRRESVIELVQTLDDHLGLAQHRHEIRVSVPTRNDMPVQVAGQPRPRGLALVQPDVVALRPEHPVEDRHHPLQRLNGLRQLRPGKLTQR